MSKVRRRGVARVERAIRRLYLLTWGRGPRWRAVRRAVALFVAQAQDQGDAGRMLRLLAWGSTVGYFVMLDLQDGIMLSGFAPGLDFWG